MPTYSQQSDKNTGDLIDASEWNQSLENTQAVRAGGIAVASMQAQDVIFATSSTQLGRLAYSTAGRFLSTNGSGSAPSWEAAPSATTASGSDTHVQFNDGGTNFGGDAGLVYNKTTDVLTAGGVAISGTGASSLDVGGGINAGTGSVALVGTDGKIEGPLSSTIIDDLSAANLTSIPGGQVTGALAAVSGAALTHLDLADATNTGTVPTARLGSGTASSAVFLRGDSSWASADPTFSGVRLYKDADQTFTSATWSTMVGITWQLESFDTDSYHDPASNPERITIPADGAGKYSLYIQCYWSTTANAMDITVYINGYARTWNPDGLANTTSQMAVVLDLDDSDYLEVRAGTNGTRVLGHSGTGNSGYSTPSYLEFYKL